jgi:hypothetical protein
MHNECVYFVFHYALFDLQPQQSHLHHINPTPLHHTCIKVKLLLVSLFLPHSLLSSLEIYDHDNALKNPDNFLAEFISTSLTA